MNRIERIKLPKIQDCRGNLSVLENTLNKPDEGLLIPNGYWRELDNFSSGGICLVLASDVFEESDYIRNFDEFLAFKKS